MAGNPDTYGNTLRFDTNDASSTDQVITKVEIGIEGYIDDYNATSYKYYVRPRFNGTLGSQYGPSSGDNFGTYEMLGFSDEIDYWDITNDGNAPSTWTWTDIQNLDVDVWAYGAAYGSRISINIHISINYG